MVTKVFKGLTGKNIKAYVDDMLVKNVLFEQHLKSLEEVFVMLRKHPMKLNLAKCVFDIKARKFLGFMLSKNGIESNTKNLKALIRIGLPRTLKEVWVPTEQRATLNRFIYKMADKCLQFFKSFPNIIDFKWIEECQSAFKDFKRYQGFP